MASLKDMKRVETKINPYLSFDEIDTWIKEEREKVQNNIITGIYGEEGAGKTGIALNIKTQDDIDSGRPLYIIDFDRGAIPLITEYYKEDKNIIPLNPVVRHENGEKRGAINPTATIQKTMSILYYISEKGNDETSAVILDGMDMFLKISEYFMREDMLKIDPMQKLNQTNWYIRDQKYDQALMLAKELPCPSVFITHLKDIMTYIDGSLEVIDTKPSWGKMTSSQMYQMIECYKIKKENSVELWTRINKAKGNLSLEGKEYLIATVPKDKDGEWKGFNWDIFR